MDNPTWEVRTGRLVLSPVGWRDIPALTALKADPVVFAQMLGGVRDPAQTAREMADDINLWARRGVGMWTVRENGGRENRGREVGAETMLGLTGIHERPDGRGLGLRFALVPAARGRGFAREAAGAALRYAHDVAQVPRVVAVTKESNFDSRTVLGSIGMRPVDSFMRGGEAMLMFASER